MSKLKSIREAKNITQEELAKRSKISMRTIQRIESGVLPKGYTLTALAKALELPETELISTSNTSIDFNKMKWLNTSSILFLVLPPLNILAPLFLMYKWKLHHPMAKDIVTVQIMWTILAPIVFMLGIFLKLGNVFTIYLICAIFCINAYLILRNTYMIDKQQKLGIKFNFSII